MELKSLKHNGVMVPDYEPQGFTIKFRGEVKGLSPKQEEMAVSWVKKLNTQYVDDPVFVENFFKDFSEEMGIDEEVGPDDFDFSEIVDFFQKKKKVKENMTKAERKAQRKERKKQRELNKEKYGYAEVNGEKVEVSNYVVEPSSIFMGRGKHPLRGRWKEGAKKSDVILNLSPDADVPEGEWKKIVWRPDCMWIARWEDKLSGKKKYVWISENSYLRQKKEIEKFDRALELAKNYDDIKDHIERNLDSDDPKRRKTATVSYLIDALKIRVGDEKDEDEADTVGATTLTKENVKIKDGNVVEFDFYGKDFVRMNREIELPDKVIENMKEFMDQVDDDEPIFKGVRSENVSLFLDEVVPGISAKVFRTFHSSHAVREYLEKVKVSDRDNKYRKKHIAKMANLQAAKVCNHRRTIPKSWEKSIEKKKERIENRKERWKKYKAKKEKKRVKWKKRRKEKVEKYTNRIEENKKKLEEYKKKMKKRDEEGKSTKGIKRRIESQKKKIKKDKERIERAEKKFKERMDRIDRRLKNRKKKDEAYIEKVNLQIEEKKATRDYNLTTSLKSYIDPRVYKKWCEKVGIDWKDYYPKSLERKFSWMDKENQD